MPSQAAADLLEEHRDRFCRPQKQDCVDLGDVDALVEDIAREDRGQLATNEPGHKLVAHRLGRLAGHRNRRQTPLVEVPSHVLRVLDGCAEPERSHAAGLGDDAVELAQDELGTNVVARIERAEIGCLVAPCFPANARQVGGVGHPEVLERGQELAVERMPETHVKGGATVGPTSDVEPVGSFRCCGEREENAGLEVIEQAPVRRRFRVVELVDDHHVEHARVELRGIVRVQRLDRSEHVAAELRPMAADEELAKRSVAQRLAERAARLAEDALSMRDEQKCGVFPVPVGATTRLRHES